MKKGLIYVIILAMIINSVSLPVHAGKYSKYSNIVTEIIEDACGFDSTEIYSFNTEAEAIAKITELEAEDIEEYGEAVREFSYYNINE